MMTMKPIVLLLLTAVALTTGSPAAPSSAREWNVRTSSPISYAVDYALYSTAEQIGYDSRKFGVDLGWVSNGGLFQFMREANNSHPAMEIKFRGMRFGRPPLVYLSFDVILRNDENGPRWFLLPSNLGSG